MVASALLEAHLPWTEPHWLLLSQAALGVLGFVLSQSLPDAKRMFVGELGLDGALRTMRGALSIARHALRAGVATLVLPAPNVAEAARKLAQYGLRPIAPYATTRG